MRYIIATLITLATACATEADTADIAITHQVRGAEQDPAACRAACRVSLGLCEIATAEDRELLADCTADCPFTADELRCFATATCGDDTTCQ